MEYNPHRVQTKAFDGSVENHLMLLYREPRLGNGFGDIPCRDRALELPAFPGLPDNHDPQSFDFVTDFCGFAFALQIVRLELCALRLEIGQILLRRA